VFWISKEVKADYTKKTSVIIFLIGKQVAIFSLANKLFSLYDIKIIAIISGAS